MRLYTALFILLCKPLALQAQQNEYMVHFDFNKTDIPDTAKLYLVKWINKNRYHQVTVEGHCDSMGSRTYNYNLSKRRAEAVKRLLVQNGTNASDVKTCIGFGKEKPLNGNVTERDRLQNRRVAVTFKFSLETKKELEVKNVLEKPKNNRVDLRTVQSNGANIQVGSLIVLQNLLFKPGSHALWPESKEELRKVLELMQENASVEVEIQGHVCCTTFQDDGYDWDTGIENLSLARAYVVYEYLIQNGIEEYRLQYKGYGGENKIHSDESTEEKRRVNRRVELKVLKR